MRNHAPPPPKPHVRPATVTNPHVIAAVLDGGARPDFRFEDIRLRIAETETVQQSAPIDPRALIERIKKSGARRVLFFIAGFNTSYAHGAADAVRVAQIVDARTLVIYTDWGSQGKALAYRRDGRSAARNGPAFGDLLAFMKANAPTEALDVFAHSMGSRVAVEGIASAAKAHHRLALQNVVLAAPDLNVKDYILAMNQIGAVSHGTIYVSRHDKALLASALIHLHHRLGQVSVERLTLPRTDIIDVTSQDHSQFGHGYALQNPSILRDIYAVVQGETSPHRVWCRSQKYPGVWLFCP